MTTQKKRIAPHGKPTPQEPEPTVMIADAETPFTYGQADYLLGADWRDYAFARADGTLTLPLDWVVRRLDADSARPTPDADPEGDDCGCVLG